MRARPQPPAQRRLSLTRWLADEQRLDADVLVEGRPVDALNADAVGTAIKPTELRKQDLRLRLQPLPRGLEELPRLHDPQRGTLLHAGTASSRRFWKKFVCPVRHCSSVANTRLREMPCSRDNSLVTSLVASISRE